MFQFISLILHLLLHWPYRMHPIKLSSLTYSISFITPGKYWSCRFANRCGSASDPVSGEVKLFGNLSLQTTSKRLKIFSLSDKCSSPTPCSDPLAWLISHRLYDGFSANLAFFVGSAAVIISGRLWLP